MAKRPITQDIVERARAQYAGALDGARAYLGPLAEQPSGAQKLISGDPMASELLARGYPQYVAEHVARSRGGGS